MKLNKKEKNSISETGKNIIWHTMPEDRIKKDCFDAVIEIPKYGKNKYELDKETGLLKLDRILYTSTHYPANYGFIPKTYADDDDPLDVLVLSNEEIYPLTLVRCIPIGVLKMVDGTALDEKIIAVAENDPFMNCYNDISALPNHISEEIMHFFEVYKFLEGKHTKIDKMYGKKEAEEIIEKCIKNYKEYFGE